MIFAGALAAAAAGAVGVPAPHEALAQKPISRTTGYSPYEKETIDRALEALGAKVDKAAEGKIIEAVDIVRLDVLEDRDPIPEKVVGIEARKLLNSLHHTSRDFVIRREMLIKEGEPFVQVLADETARNMRNRMPLQVSIVIIVPLEGSAPDKVRLLVITKDIWSLRLSFDMAVTPGGLENLLLLPQETNVFGWHHTAQTQFQYQPESLRFGLAYKVPRFGASWIGAAAAASITVNQRSGEPEGAGVSLEVGQGLYSTRTEWGWGAEAGFGSSVVRRYVNARVGAFNSAATSTVRDNIPTEYKSRSYSASVGVTRSFGWAYKNNFGLTLNAASSEYRTFDLSRFDPAAAADFVQRFIPLGETRVYPALSWASFKNDFLRTVDVNTLALQEDFQLGHTLSASVYPVAKALGSSRDLWGISGSAGYRVPLGDGFANVAVTAFAENSGDVITDGSVAAGMSVVTPRFGIGRLVTSMSFSNRFANYLRSRAVTGGDDRLRGYPSNFFFGKDTVFYNLEFRSRSIEILKSAIGGVLYYDVGDAAQGLDKLSPKHSIGFGVRALFPQVNRAVLRLDFAFPLNRGPFPEQGIDARVDPMGFFFSFGQAF